MSCLLFHVLICSSGIERVVAVDGGWVFCFALFYFVPFLEK